MRKGHEHWVHKKEMQIVSPFESTSNLFVVRDANTERSHFSPLRFGKNPYSWQNAVLARVVGKHTVSAIAGRVWGGIILWKPTSKGAHLPPASPLLEISSTDTPTQVWNHTCTVSHYGVVCDSKRQHTTCCLEHGARWINQVPLPSGNFAWWDRKRKIHMYRYREISRILLLREES